MNGPFVTPSLRAVRAEAKVTRSLVLRSSVPRRLEDDANLEEPAMSNPSSVNSAKAEWKIELEQGRVRRRAVLPMEPAAKSSGDDRIMEQQLRRILSNSLKPPAYLQQQQLVLSSASLVKVKTVESAAMAL